MTLFTHFEDHDSGSAPCFELLSVLADIMLSQPERARSLIFAFFSAVQSRSSFFGRRGSGYHRSTAVTPEELGGLLGLGVSEANELVSEFRKAAPRLPVRYGRAGGYGDEGLVLFDVLGVHDRSDVTMRTSWWVRPGLWIVSLVSPGDRDRVFKTMTCLAQTKDQNTLKTASACAVALEYARCEGWITGGESVLLSRLMKTAEDQIDFVARARLLEGDEATLVAALDVLLSGDVITSHSRDLSGNIWVGVEDPF